MRQKVREMLKEFLGAPPFVLYTLLHVQSQDKIWASKSQFDFEHLCLEKNVKKAIIASILKNYYIIFFFVVVTF